MATIDPTKAVQRQYTTSPLPRSLIPSIPDTAQPHILWIGCSDSWITETETLDVGREELFVVRNLGGVVSNGDLSSGSAVEYSVGVLKVDHIIVCGHYDCGLVKNDEGPEADRGWHRDLSLLHKANEEFCQGKGMEMEERNRRLEELWVLAEVEWLRGHEIVKRAVEQREVKVYGVVFDKASGEAVLLEEK